MSNLYIRNYGLIVDKGISTSYIYPASDSTTAFQIRKANGTTVVANFDTTNGRMGIGTTTPSTTFHIAGAQDDNNAMLKLQGLSTNAGDTAGLTLWTRPTPASSSSRNWQMAVNYNTAGGLEFLRSTTSTGNPTTNAVIFDGNGNVGIGVTSLSYKFEINGIAVLGAGVQSSMPSTGGAYLTGNVGSGDVPGMVLYNAGGGAGASVSIDFYNTTQHSNIPQAKIKAIDDGFYSDHLLLMTKIPGAPANAITERMRINSYGEIGMGISTKLSALTVQSRADVSNIGGTTTANASTTITGVSTAFLNGGFSKKPLGVGDRISLSSASTTYATITAIASDTSLTVDTALGDGTSQTINVKKSLFRLNNPSGVPQFLVNDLGNVGIGITPTAVLHLKAGTATASTAPLKFTSGVNLTTAEAGAIEFTTDDFYATITTGASRKGIILNDGTNLTATRVPFVTTNGRLTDDSDMTFVTDTLTVTKIVGTTSIKVGTAGGFISSDNSTGATGTFTTVDLKTITVKDGIITSIV